MSCGVERYNPITLWILYHNSGCIVKVFGFEYPSMMYYEEKRRHNRRVSWITSHVHYGKWYACSRSFHRPLCWPASDRSPPCRIPYRTWTSRSRSRWTGPHNTAEHQTLESLVLLKSDSSDHRCISLRFLHWQKLQKPPPRRVRGHERQSGSIQSLFAFAVEVCSDIILGHPAFFLSRADARIELAH